MQKAIAPGMRAAAEPTSARWSALGTTAAVFVTDPDALAEACAIVMGELDAIDRACSRFRADSELESVNRRAPRPVVVGALLIEAVEVGLRAVRVSDGDVDPALGEALLLAGYDRDFELLEQPAGGEFAQSRAVARAGLPGGEGRPTAPRDPWRTPIRARRVAGWRTIQVDRERSTIGVGRGVRLDLGATAKALAADRAAAAVSAATGVGALVNLGGDLAVAGAPPEGGWPVFVTDDHRNTLDAQGQLIRIGVGGLATSSVTRRRWLHRGETNHHIIDPETGLPARSCWRTASVAAASCVDANIASTTALIRGEEGGAWLTHLELPARLVTHAGEVHTIGDWPPEGTNR